MPYETIIVEMRGKVTLITLNPPKALNALNTQVLSDLLSALKDLDADPAIAASVLTGSEKAFAAGADLKEMVSMVYARAYLADTFSGWEEFTPTRKPVIAAVAGYALGGGCELAMMCDIIIAADTAKFGQPEITLGVMPGMGGPQRLAHVARRVVGPVAPAARDNMRRVRRRAPARQRSGCAHPAAAAGTADRHCDERSPPSSWFR